MPPQETKTLNKNIISKLQRQVLGHLTQIYLVETIQLYMYKHPSKTQNLLPIYFLFSYFKKIYWYQKITYTLRRLSIDFKILELSLSISIFLFLFLFPFLFFFFFFFYDIIVTLMAAYS